jgi:heme/copper-type cytochrome/quinol oxidase subunit 1
LKFKDKNIEIDRSLNSQRISFLSLVKNCNHKGLGIYYLLSAFIFGISGTLISVLIRIELYSAGNRIISPENQNFYNISITLHGFLMIFFLVMPAVFGGFGNYFVPIFQGSPEVVYPRVNNFSILILSLSYLFVILSLFSEFGAGTGWTLYPPLSTSFMSLSPSSTAYLIFGLLISGISSCLTSLNFWTTIINLRSYYLTLKIMPLFLWSLLLTGGMLLFTLPILSGALLMVLADLHSNTLFFDPIFGGDPIFYQHLFWFFGHPEVYILIIPAFGIISIIISGILQKIIFGNQSMIFAMSCISLLGSVVWGHHMYTVGLETDTRAYFSGVTILISLPTGTKIFNWLSTYLGNPPLLQLKTNSPFFGLLFLLMFTIGGSTGIILGNAAVDLGLHDTYYVGLEQEKTPRKCPHPTKIGSLVIFHLVSTFIGILLTFSPMHFLGFNVMPRRIPDFPDSFHSWNFLSSIGSGITFLSFAIFFHLIIIWSLFSCFWRGERLSKC